jgi:hypothetical protein
MCNIPTPAISNDHTPTTILNSNPFHTYTSGSISRHKFSCRSGRRHAKFACANLQPVSEQAANCNTKWHEFTVATPSLK